MNTTPFQQVTFLFSNATASGTVTFDRLEFDAAAVPEPGSALLLAAGFAALIITAGLRRSRQL